MASLSIRIRSETKKILFILKAENNHKSIDETINFLIKSNKKTLGA